MSLRLVAPLLVLALAAGALGCAKPILATHERGPASAPPLPAGCAIALDPATALPPGAVDLGRVRANCDRDDVPEAACLRALRDEACALGADRVYWVHDVSKAANRRILLAQAARPAP